MKKKWSSKWVASKQPRKQRKYVANLPVHKLKDMMKSMLSKELKTKYKKNSITVRKGDKVKIMRGEFGGKSGKVDKVLYRKKRVHIDIAKKTKKDGNAVFKPIHPSNLQILELVTDKKRTKRLEGAKK